MLPISKHDVEAVEAGRKAMIIAATFIYTDALGTHGLTTLALTYLPDQHRFTYGPQGQHHRIAAQGWQPGRAPDRYCRAKRLGTSEPCAKAPIKPPPLTGSAVISLP